MGNKPLIKVGLLLAMLLLVGLAVWGCTGTAPARGWSGIAAADSTLFLGSMTGKLNALDSSGGSGLWEVPLAASKPSGGFGCAPAAAALAIYGTPAVDGDLVYVGGYDGKIYTIISSTHSSREPRYLDKDNPQPIVGGLTVSQGKVFVGSSDGKLYALEGDSLKELWKFATEDKIWSTPAVSGDSVYVGSFDKKLYARRVSDGGRRWEFETSGAIAATPLVNNGVVYAGSFDRYLYAIDAASGNLKWKFQSGSWFWARPVAYGNAVYAPSLDGKVYALNASTGDKLADFNLGSPISSSPVLVGQQVIIVTEDGMVYTLDTASNKISNLTTLKTKRGGKQTVYAPLAARGGIVYIHTQTKQNETVYALNAAAGTISWEHPLQ